MLSTKQKTRCSPQTERPYDSRSKHGLSLVHAITSTIDLAINRVTSKDTHTHRAALAASRTPQETHVAARGQPQLLTYNDLRAPINLDRRHSEVTCRGADSRLCYDVASGTLKGAKNEHTSQGDTEPPSDQSSNKVTTDSNDFPTVDFLARAWWQHWTSLNNEKNSQVARDSKELNTAGFLSNIQPWSCHGNDTRNQITRDSKVLTAAGFHPNLQQWSCRGNEASNQVTLDSKELNTTDFLPNINQCSFHNNETSIQATRDTKVMYFLARENWQQSHITTGSNQVTKDSKELNAFLPQTNWQPCTSHGNETNKKVETDDTKGSRLASPVPLGNWQHCNCHGNETSKKVKTDTKGSRSGSPVTKMNWQPCNSHGNETNKKVTTNTKGSRSASPAQRGNWQRCICHGNKTNKKVMTDKKDSLPARPVTRRNLQPCNCHGNETNKKVRTDTKGSRSASPVTRGNWQHCSPHSNNAGNNFRRDLVERPVLGYVSWQHCTHGNEGRSAVKRDSRGANVGGAGKAAKWQQCKSSGNEKSKGATKGAKESSTDRTLVRARMRALLQERQKRKEATTLEAKKPAGSELGSTAARRRLTARRIPGAVKKAARKPEVTSHAEREKASAGESDRDKTPTRCTYVSESSASDNESVFRVGLSTVRTESAPSVLPSSKEVLEFLDQLRQQHLKTTVSLPSIMEEASRYFDSQPNSKLGLRRILRQSRLDQVQRLNQVFRGLHIIDQLVKKLEEDVVETEEDKEVAKSLLEVKQYMTSLAR